jgi:hypothetical protein
VRRSCHAIPYQGGFALISNADGNDVREFQSAIFKCFPTTLQAGVPDILSVVLHPAITGEVLRKALLSGADAGAVTGEYDSAAACRALINR